LEAEMVARGLTELLPSPGTYVLIENVGNLVCPALFDLGEQTKVAILSVTEGTDKPAKYPPMFQAASLMIINKIDLTPYVDFDANACIGFAREVTPSIEVIQLSATRGDGVDAWHGWLERQRSTRPNEERS
jgi:hydrogenase nickel incorporation protein HypB